MEEKTVTEELAEAGERESLDSYNFAHFRREHLLADMRLTVAGQGIRPGEPAPEFSLEDTDGNRINLGELHDKPVLLRFGSFT